MPLRHCFQARTRYSQDKNLILKTNLRSCELLGVSGSALAKQSINRFIFRSDLDIYYLNRKRLAETGHTQSFELRMVKKDGTALWMHLEMNAAKEQSSAPTFRLVLTDIEKQKKTEEELRESEKRFHAIFNQAGVGAALLETTTGRFVHINQRCCDFVGYSMQEMLAKTFMDITLDEDVQQNTAQNTSLMEGKSRKYSIEKRYLHKNGTIVWGLLTTSPLWEAEEKPSTCYHIAIVEDITDRKLAEKTIECLLAEKELLLREVHHRIKNNMSSIIGLLNLQANSADNANEASALQSARLRIYSMLVMYDSLYRSHDLRSVSSEEYFRSLAEGIRNSLPGLEDIDLRLRCDNISIRADKLFPLGIIVNECITNAVKYAFPKKEGRTIWLDFKVGPGGQSVLLIADDGIGIDMSSPGVSSPGVSSPGVSSPGVSSPGVSSPGVSSPGVSSPGFGFTLINGLIGQLEGVLELKSGSETIAGKGTEIHFSFGCNDGDEERSSPVK